MFEALAKMGVEQPIWWILCVLGAGFVAGKIMIKGDNKMGVLVSLTFGVLGGLLVKWICKVLPVEIFHNDIWYVWFLQGLIGAILIFAVINKLRK
ncbi:MAG: hypothetical protein MJZ61_05195 [Bacteroidales bacterium]|nr:hypothetical protein [Bacteroidales bacterium]